MAVGLGQVSAADGIEGCENGLRVTVDQRGDTVEPAVARIPATADEKQCEEYDKGCSHFRTKIIKKGLPDKQKSTISAGYVI